MSSSGPGWEWVHALPVLLQADQDRRRLLSLLGHKSKCSGDVGAWPRRSLDKRGLGELEAPREAFRAGRSHHLGTCSPPHPGQGSLLQHLRSTHLASGKEEAPDTTLQHRPHAQQAWGSRWTQPAEELGDRVSA